MMNKPSWLSIFSAHCVLMPMCVAIVSPCYGDKLSVVNNTAMTFVCSQKSPMDPPPLPKLLTILPGLNNTFTISKDSFIYSCFAKEREKVQGFIAKTAGHLKCTNPWPQVPGAKVGCVGNSNIQVTLNNIIGSTTSSTVLPLLIYKVIYR